MSSPHVTSNPMLTRSPEATGSAVPPAVAGRASDRTVPPTPDPDAILDRIRWLITDHFLDARRLAIESAARFPDHAGIQNAKRILAEGTATVGTGGPLPSRGAEFAWLRNPPEAVRGKWVALVGGEMVGAADSLVELEASLRPRIFARTPLVHRID